MTDAYCAHTVLKFVIIDGVTCWSCGNCGEPFVPNHHVERLTAERDKTAEAYTLNCQAMDALYAERDRLRAERDSYIAESKRQRDELNLSRDVAKAYKAERDRLRAALEYLSDKFGDDFVDLGGDAPWSEVVRVAREALAYPTSPKTVGDRPEGASTSSRSSRPPE